MLMQKETKRQAFTLIELLVVVAIIALLLSIMTPALRKAKDIAQTIVCQTNLKQYGIATQLYLNDYGQRFPDPRQWLLKSGYYPKPGQDPDGCLWPYLASLDVHMCPKFSTVKMGTTCETYAFSYSMNAYLNPPIWSNWLGANIKGVSKATEVHRPSGVVIFVEENAKAIKGYSGWPLNDTHFTVGNKTNFIDNYATYHRAPDSQLEQGAGNMVFVDGSVNSLFRKNNDLDVGFRLAWPKASVR